MARKVTDSVSLSRVQVVAHGAVPSAILRVVSDAERATLGAILLNRDAITPIAPWLAATAFYDERHGWIYEAMLACYSNSTPCKRASMNSVTKAMK